jgi:spermidine synthase
MERFLKKKLPAEHFVFAILVMGFSGKVVQKFPTPLTGAELADPRVNIEYLDGRFFIKKTPHKYDLVLIGISNPSTLQINRLFSKKFFSLVKERLEKGGILVMVSPGSLTYLSKALGDLNACILNTLKEVYPYVRVIPGDFKRGFFN